ncbi:MAG: DNA translocase FtsK [Acholeplasmatales bacterium]|nr:DNA translocase FtsK [Acholeplasmatales bacterium]
MFFRKKKKENLSATNTNYVIPQIISPYQGIKKTRDHFVKSTLVNPIFGTGVKEKLSYHDSSEDLGDTDRKYDSFRDKGQRKVSDEELIAKYGTRFPEFQQIDLEKAKEIYGSEVRIEKAKASTNNKKEASKEFNFIKSASDLVNNEPKEENGIDFSLEFDDDKSDDDYNPFQKMENFKPELKEETNQNDNYFSRQFNSRGEYVNENTAIVRRNRYESKEASVFDDPKFTHKVTKDTSMYPTHVPDPLAQAQEPAMASPLFEELKKINPEQNDFDLHVKTSQVFEEKPSYTEFDDLANEEEQNVSYIEPTALEMPTIINPYRDYKLPTADLFSRTKNEDDSLPDWIHEKEEIINNTLQSFAISGSVSHYVLGPTFTRYEILLDTGVNVRKVLSIQDNLQMNLGVKSIRIQAPIPGKRTVGIEVPNDKRKTVLFGDTLSEEFINDGKPLNVVLGKDIDGNIIYSNIAKWPHGLIAGGTGSGKSVCINTVIVSMLLKCKPNQVKFIMIDPKQVELSIYNDLPHQITPVISDPKMASTALKWAVNEMERRFTQFTTVRARDIVSYNEKAEEDPTLQKMCYIVIVIDELADLMMTCGQDVEDSIQRITQKARAAGIHLLVATQRPTVDVVKGTIKANIQCRLAFRVSSQVDSQTILDEVGAESLLGYGDMLLKEDNFARRVQGSYIPDEEIEKVVDFICNQAKPDYQLTHKDLESSETADGFGGLTTNEESQDLMYEIAKWCCINQSCSINSICQNFSLGFNRAQRIVQCLEEMNIVSERKGTKRDILVDLNQINDIFERGE